ncbi:MAG: type III polyketide synthase [Bacteroidota bacterium]|nr:type III polyketide synthase [Bacteroidota bacterium]
MPEIIAISKIDFPYKTSQSKLKDFAKKVFSDNYKDIDRLLESFDNAKINCRNLCVPVDFFYSPKSFSEKNDLYIQYSLKYSVEAIEMCLKNSGIHKKDITDIIFISTTGISTPSIDALIANQLRLNPNINRTPVWGLGCAGGVAGIAKANTIATANPEALVLLVAVELCSLTFISNDMSKSNFIATSLFSDGVSAVLIKGDNFRSKDNTDFKINIVDSQSKLYYDSLDVMGWDIHDDGFKVVFSKDIPTIVNENVKEDIPSFLKKHNLEIENIKNFITHPGGVKVINAYIDALEISPDLLFNAKEVLKDYGNMSSTTVLYVLEKFMKNGFENGYGLMMSLGPGFSSELVLLEIVKS